MEKDSESTNFKAQSKEPEVNPNMKNEKKESLFVRFVKNNQVLTTALIGIIALFIVFIWKDIESKREKNVIIKTALVKWNEKHHEMLKLLGQPLVWGIRNEMMRENMEQVNLFTANLVRKEQIQFIHLIEPSGNVLSSTNKKLEGQSALNLFKEEVLSADSILITLQEDGLILLSAPVMGFDRRLATIILAYKIEELELN